jgi:hypothetical protein
VGKLAASILVPRPKAVGDDGLKVSSRAATILARRMGKAPSVDSPEGMAERASSDASKKPVARVVAATRLPFS